MIIRGENVIKAENNRYSFINKSLISFLLVLIVTATLLILHFKNIIIIDPSIIHIVRFFMSFAIVIVITNIVLRFTVNKAFRLFEKELEIEQRILFSKLYTIFVYAIAVSVILYLGGVELKDITLVLGLLTTGLAFAIRDIIMSFFVWLIILTKKPFKIGDVITSAEDTGKVDRIGMFYVTLRVKNGPETHIVRVPNKMLLDRNMKNHGKNKISGEVRLVIKNVPANIEDWIKEVTKIIQDIKAEIHISLDSSDDKLVMNIKYLTDYDQEKETRLKIISKIYKSHEEYFKEIKNG